MAPHLLNMGEQRWIMEECTKMERWQILEKALDRYLILSFCD